MAEQTRATLRQYFAAGNLPTEEHFGDLVESMLNMKDEGFRKTPANGLEVTAAAGRRTLQSFYRENDPANPVWALRHGLQGDALQFDHGSAGEDGAMPPLLALRTSGGPAEGDGNEPLTGRVGINTAAPGCALDVAGVLAMQGRRGRYAENVATQLPADGKPHNLIDKLTGCQAFEVVAGVGRPDSGRYALLHAVVLNTFNPVVPWWRWLWPGARRRGIRATAAQYGRRCDRLLLQWDGTHGKDAQYALQVRTGCDYGNGVVIQCSVTQLWFDPHMRDSAAAPS
jgi:hypothetical protein